MSEVQSNKKKDTGRSSSASFFRKHQVELMLLLFLALLATFLRMPLAAIPLERDEGEYAYIAQRWLKGEVPYKESFDQKPPFVFAVYAVILKIFGETPSDIHWGAHWYSLLTVTIIFLLGRKLFNNGVGTLAGVFFIFMHGDKTVLGNAANTETFMVLPIVAGMYIVLLAIEKNSIGFAIGSGIASALACFSKQVAVPDLVFYFLLLLVLSQKRWLLAGAMAVGTAATIGIICFYFWASGAWHEFFDCVIGHNLKYASKIPLEHYPTVFWRSFSMILRSCWPIYLFAFLSVAYLVPRLPFHRFEKKHVLLMMGWLIFSFAGVCAGGYFRQHYFIQILPMVSLLAGLGLHFLGTLPFLREFRILFCSALAGMALIHGISKNAWYYGSQSPEDKCRQIYGTNPFVESIEVAKFVKANSNPEDMIFVLGSEPQIFFYADRKSASRYIFVYPLTAEFPDTPARQRSVIEEVEKNDPRYIITVFIPTSLLLTSTSPLELFNHTGQRLNASYKIVGLTYFTPEEKMEFMTGEAAAETWKQDPMWYNTKLWGSMIVWEKKRTIP